MKTEVGSPGEAKIGTWVGKDKAGPGQSWEKQLGLVRETFRKLSRWLIKLKGHGGGKGPRPLAGEGTVAVMLIRDQGEGGDLGNMPGPVWDFMDVGGSEAIQGGRSQEASGPLV